MKKRLLLSLVLIPVLLGGVAATGAFASGQSEEPSRPYGRRGQGPGQEWPAPTFSEDTIKVTGELYFQNRMHPELESGGKDYELLVPRYYVYEADLKEGQTVTVEGYTVTGMPMFEGEDGDEVHLWVTKAIIDGKEYDLERYGRGPMGGGHMWGPGRGRSGRRGPAPYGGYGPCPGWGDGPGWQRQPSGSQTG